MIIGLFPNEMKKQSLDIASEVCQFLKKQNVDVVCDDQFALQIGARPLSTVIPQDVDFRISFGGDGTILRIGSPPSPLAIPFDWESIWEPWLSC